MRIKQCLLTVMLVVAGARSISGQTPTLVDFEEFAGPTCPDVWLMCLGVPSHGVSFTGGYPFQYPPGFAADSTVLFSSNNYGYVSGARDDRYMGMVTIDFPAPVSSVSFLLVSPPPWNEGAPPNSFTITDCRQQSLEIAPFVGAQTVVVPWASVSCLFIYVGGMDWVAWTIDAFRTFGIDNVSFVAAARQMQVVATLSPGSSETAQVSGSPLTAHVPLGAGLTLSLQDAGGTPIPATYSLGTPSVADGVDADAVFPGAVLLWFSNPPDSSSAKFQALHLGSVPVTITPTDGTASTVNISIAVEPPAKLGPAHPEVDGPIISASHAKGVLPQYIKAVARQESGGTFNRTAYRYEPIGRDTGDLDVMSHGRNLRLQSPYADYRLATSPEYGASDPPLAQGGNIDQADIDVRDIYWILRPDCSIPGSIMPILRPIKPCDAFVEAAEIYFLNPTQNWSTGSKGRLVQRNPALLYFTAQTGLASSYGLMQVMYATAISYLRWQGITDPSGPHPAGSKNPSFLLDTDDNLAIGGGSVRLGAGFLARKVVPAVLKYGPPVLTGEADLRRAFEEALGRYNSDPDYPSSVVGFIDPYLPVANRTIF